MNKRNLMLLVLLLCGLGLYLGYYLYNKPTAKVSDLKSDFTLSAGDLLKEFDDNEDQATLKYNNKVVAVTGIVESVSTGENGIVIITLSPEQGTGTISCEMDQGFIADSAKVQKGGKLLIRGVCAGKLIDVVLNRCALAD